LQARDFVSFGDFLRPGAASRLDTMMATQPWTPLERVLLAFSLLTVIATAIGIAFVMSPNLG
jgi:hypothetical protein